MFTSLPPESVAFFKVTVGREYRQIANGRVEVEGVWASDGGDVLDIAACIKGADLTAAEYDVINLTTEFAERIGAHGIVMFKPFTQLAGMIGWGCAFVKLGVDADVKVFKRAKVIA